MDEKQRERGRKRGREGGREGGRGREGERVLILYHCALYIYVYMYITRLSINKAHVHKENITSSLKVAKVSETKVVLITGKSIQTIVPQQTIPALAI